MNEDKGKPYQATQMVKNKRVIIGKTHTQRREHTAIYILDVISRDINACPFSSSYTVSNKIESRAVHTSAHRVLFTLHQVGRKSHFDIRKAKTK